MKLAPTSIRTYSGIFIDPFEATTEQIHINDIAHALANTCRFGGHTTHYYSVARHSLKVAHALSAHGPRMQLAGLLHDASEAYLCDVPRPIKHRPEMSGYRHAEAELQRIIFERYELPWPMPAEVHAADARQLALELEVGRYEWWSVAINDEWAFLYHFKQWSSQL